MILYSPDGQAVEVMPGRERTLLKQGYRATPLVPTEFVQASESILKLIRTTGTIDLNTADLKTLTDLPQVGIAIAKRIIQHRPYKTVEDVIAAVPEVTWLELRDRIAIAADNATNSQV
jgi:DNA uptake protein ComE-like DNA-binding protein